MRVSITNTYTTAVDVPAIGTLRKGATDTREWTAAQFNAVKTALDALVTATSISYKLNTATATWDPASTADGAVTSTTVSVPGAAIGEPVSVGFSVAVPAGAFLTADVTATGTVTVKLLNKTGSTLDLASGTVTLVIHRP